MPPKKKRAYVCIYMLKDWPKCPWPWRKFCSTSRNLSADLCPLRRVSVEGVWSNFRYWTIHEAAKSIIKHMHIGGVNFPHPFKYIILMWIKLLRLFYSARSKTHARNLWGVWGGLLIVIDLERTFFTAQWNSGVASPVIFSFLAISLWPHRRTLKL